MVKRFVPDKGSGPSMDDLAKEAEAELRRAGGLGQPQRSMTPTRSAPPTRTRVAPPPAEDLYGPDDLDDDDDEYESWTPEEEAQAVTNFAAQQLAERTYRPTTSQYRGSPASMSSSPEEMRNRAMAEILERQRRLAQEKPLPTRPNRVVESPTVGARARAAPILTAAPMVNLPRAAGVPRDSGARASMGAGSPMEGVAAGPRTRQRGAFAQKVDAVKRRDAGGGPPAEEPGGTLVTTRRGVTRRSTPRNPPTPNSHRSDNGETADPGTVSVGEAGSPAAGDGRGTAPVRDGSLVDPQGSMTAASHATLSAIAVLLASMEVLPAPSTGDRDQSRLYQEVSQHMTRLSVLLEQYLNALPPEWPAG